MKQKIITILIPVFNDFESLNILLDQISDLYKNNSDIKLTFVIINDNSEEDKLNLLKNHNNLEIKIIHLVKNMGHQRAIAIGLSYIVENYVSDYVVIMDSDGEDKPEHIKVLLQEAKKQNNRIVFAKRSKRKESIIYRFFYFIYKLFFKILTGKTISFGNFCIIPKSKLKNIVYLPEIWIHFSGAIVNSKIPYSSIPLEKGNRISGKSKMNFTALVIHGLSAMSVNAEILIVRLILFSIVLILTSFTCLISSKIISLYSTSIFPEVIFSFTVVWALISIQLFFIFLLFAFFILNRRVQKNLIPIFEYKHYISNNE